MRRIIANQPIVAIAYSETTGAASALRRLGDVLIAAGAECAGYVEVEVLP